MNKNYIKIVLLGDGRVGKTSILNRYINNTFDDKQEMTVNCSYYQKDLEFDGVKYTFCLWDTAGQEKFNALTNIYYRDAKGAILVYDVSIKETFKKVEKWHNELKVFNAETVIAIAGNKIDIGKIDVDNNTIESYCNETGVEHIFTSAKTGEGLEEIFNKVAKEIAQKMSNENNAKSKKKTLKITSNDETMIDKRKKGNDGCC